MRGAFVCPGFLRTACALLAGRSPCYAGDAVVFLGVAVFSSAVTNASHYTFPYVGLRLHADGEVRSVAAAFMVINEQGWIVTSAHVIEEILASRSSAEGGERSAGDAQRVVERSEIWAIPGFNRLKPGVREGRVNPGADLATGRLDPFDPSVMTGYPVFRDTQSYPLSQGESVCRLGFPFHGVSARYDTARRSFDVAGDAFPVPSFALDGIIARFNRRSGPDGASALFVETSSPGLRGQSGGPLLDVDGRVCGVQSHTAHLDLGFNASYVDGDGARVVERQFLNVGLASHVDEVRALLDQDGVSYRVD